jgi:quinoprotein glucose dehydrogenase
MASAVAQTGAKNGEWTTYGGDLGNTHYSPLDQITAASFNSLEVAWRFKTDFLGPSPEYQFEGSPLMVRGKLYLNYAHKERPERWFRSADDDGV